MMDFDLTDEEIETMTGQSPEKLSRLEKQRLLGQAMRMKGTLGGGVRAPGVFVAESPFAAIGDLASRWQGRKQERDSTQALDDEAVSAQDRQRLLADMLRRKEPGQAPQGPQMSPVPNQPPTQLFNPNQPQPGLNPQASPTGGAPGMPGMSNVGPGDYQRLIQLGYTPQQARAQIESMQNRR